MLLTDGNKTAPSCSRAATTRTGATRGAKKLQVKQITTPRPLPPMLLPLSLSLLLQLCSATSNLNPVWLTSDERPLANQEQQSANNSSGSGSSASSSTRTGGQFAQRLGDHWSESVTPSAGFEHQMAPSSLQPFIVPLESEAPASGRRLDSDAGQLHYARLPNNSLGRDEVGSPDLQLWNQTNNAQVQFDEEHQSQPGAGRLVGRNSTQQLGERRQDNETSTLSPQYESPTRAENEIPLDQVYEYPVVGGSNFSRSSQRQPGQDFTMFNNHEQQQAALNDTFSHRRFPTTTTTTAQSLVYHPSDKWIPTSTQFPTSSATRTGFAGGNRRKLHNSGTQYDLRERNRFMLNNLGANSPLPLSHPSINEPDQMINGLGKDHRGSGPNSYQLDNENFLQIDYDQTRATAPDSDQTTGSQSGWLHYGLDSPHRPKFGSSGSLRTTPMPLRTISSASHVYLPQSSLATFDLLAARAPPIGQQTVSYPTRKQARRRAQSVQTIQGQPDATQRTNSMLWPQKAQIDRSRLNGRALLGNGYSPTILGSYTRPSSLMQSKPKKSLLGVFGNRAYTLSDSSLAQSLENSFYENMPKQQEPRASNPYLKPPKRWSAANYYAMEPEFLNQVGATGEISQSGSYGYGTQAVLPAQAYTRPPTITEQPYGFLRPPIAYYPNGGIAGPRGGLLGSVSVQQPTVAPASEHSLDRFYGLHSPSVHPVRRRRYPTGYELQGERAVGPSSGELASHPRPASFIPVVAVSVTRTSPAPKAAQQAYEQGEQIELNQNLGPDRLSSPNSNRVQMEEFGDAASGSALQDSAVKYSASAQNSRNPLGRAEESNHGEHTTTIKSAVFGYLPHQADEPLLSAINMIPRLSQRAYPADSHATSASNPYVNQAEQESHLINEIPISRATQGVNMGAFEEPPSLALQLQANNFAQNDIAHPFANRKTYLLPQVASSSPYEGQRSAHLRPVDVYQDEQQQYHGYPLLQPQYHGRFHGDPLVNSVFADSSLRGAHLMTSASQMSPFVPQVLFASPTADGHQRGQSYSESSSDIKQQQLQSDEPEPSRGSSQLNKGRKRSSDFFASAGQLLLSALPLLLAPTLGLMFASSPSSVARYQGPNPFSSDSGRVHTTIPGTYINGLSSGQVSNASPAPQLFTPIPLVYNFTGTTVAPQRQPSHRPTSVAPNALSTKNGARNATTSTAHPKIAVILTTLSPPPFFNESDSPPSNYSRDSMATASSSNSSVNLLATNTLLLLEAPNEGASEHEQEQDKATNFNSRNHYDIGYEGADFDAQFATLRRTADTKNVSYFDRVHKSQHRQPTTVNKDSRNQHHQYSSTRLASDHSRPNKGSNATNLEDVSTRLYPVSTWPPMRRRTVSLVTSSGNKTLADASDRYQKLDSFNWNQTLPVWSRKVIDSLDEPSDDSTLSTSRFAKTNGSLEVGGDLVLADGASGAKKIKSSLAASNLVRSRRSLLNTTNTNDKSTDKPRKRVKVLKLIKLRHRDQSKQVGGYNLGTMSAMESSGSVSSSGEQMDARKTKLTSDNGEPMKHDASKSKSAHIIATMITHSDEEDDPAKGGEQADGGDYESSFGQDRQEEEVRGRLFKKKAMLDKIATTNSFDPQAHFDRQRLDEFGHFEDNRHYQQPGPANEGLSAGGRGRFPSAPIGVISTRVRLSGNKSEPLDRHTFDGRERGSNLVLNESTKKALANFGTLLMKDSLQASQGNQNHAQGDRQRLKTQVKSELRSDAPIDANTYRRLNPRETDDRYDPHEATGTERSFIRTTPLPDSIGFIEAGYHDRRNEGVPQMHAQQRYQQHNPRRAEEYDLKRLHNGTQAELEPRRFIARPIRDRVNLVENEISHYGPSDDRSAQMSDDYHNGHAYVTPAPDKYNQHPQGHTYNPYQVNHINTDASIGHDQTRDIRFSSYANNTDRRNELPSYGPDSYHYDGYYSVPNRREPSPQLPPAPPPPPLPAHHHHHHHHQPSPPPPPPPTNTYETAVRNYPPRGPMYSVPGSHFNATTYAPNTYASAYHSSPKLSASNHYNHQTPQNSYNHNYEYQPSQSNYYRGTSGHKVDHPIRLPVPEPVRAYPPRPEPAENYPPPSTEYYNDGSHRYPRNHQQQPEPTYSPSVISGSDLFHHGGPLAVVSSSEKGESRAVNEYLKRVQFSDSDRDKLMAR